MAVGAKLTDRQNFNPRPPRGGRLQQRPPFDACPTFQSTPSARRATRALLDANHRPAISIHALREEGDEPGPVWEPDKLRISIHALREEGDNQGNLFRSP